MSIPRGPSPRLLVLTLALACAACGHGGPYGFARSYKPLPEEKPHYREAERLTYQDVLREPNAYRDQVIGWFGVVTGLSTAPDGRTRLSLALRRHQERHLCAETSSNSCRVTVSETDMGPFSADLVLREEDRNGRHRIWQGSLIKIYGSPTGELDEQGGPVFDVQYYRHWPRGKYVTTAARSLMRL